MPAAATWGRRAPETVDTAQLGGKRWKRTAALRFPSAPAIGVPENDAHGIDRRGRRKQVLWTLSPPTFVEMGAEQSAFQTLSGADGFLTSGCRLAGYRAEAARGSN